MTTGNDGKPVLVIGGTGKTGRRVAERLAAQGLPTRIGSRNSEHRFDWEDRSTWGTALSGTEAAYIAYFPDLAVPGAPEAVESLARVAAENGVRRLVLLSGRGETEAERSEELLRASGAEWTIVRASWFMQNFSEAFLADAVRDGVVALPVGAVGEPFIDADDIADVATAALTDARHVGQLYEVTGPRLLTFAEATAEIAAATGRDVRFVEISQEEFAAGMAQAGLPDDYVRLVMYLFTEVLDGRSSKVTDGVTRALGRVPRDFRDYARQTAASGVWNPV